MIAMKRTKWSMVVVMKASRTKAQSPLTVDMLSRQDIYVWMLAMGLFYFLFGSLGVCTSPRLYSALITIFHDHVYVQPYSLASLNPTRGRTRGFTSYQSAHSGYNLS